MHSSFIDFRLQLNGVAWAVLHALEGEPSFAPWNDKEARYEIDCETSAFYNCRERGFSLCVSHPKRRFSGKSKRLYIAFAENRNSDHIVVYTWDGEHMMNPPTPNDLTDEVWTKSRHFDTIDQAVGHIRELMKDFLEVEQRLVDVEHVMAQ